MTKDTTITGRPESWRVVITNWWQEGDPERWPDGLEPDGSIQRVLATGITDEARARQISRGWNAVHNPGRLSTKAEIEQEPADDDYLAWLKATRRRLAFEGHGIQPAADWRAFYDNGYTAGAAVYEVTRQESD